MTEIEDFNTVHYAAWHYPCYRSFNCPKRGPGANLVEVTTTGPTLQKAGFQEIAEWSTFVLLFLTIVLSFFGSIFICGALCANRGGVRPLNQVSYWSLQMRPQLWGV